MTVRRVVLHTLLPNHTTHPIPVTLCCVLRTADLPQPLTTDCSTTPLTPPLPHASTPRPPPLLHAYPVALPRAPPAMAHVPPADTRVIAIRLRASSAAS